ncbi:hypothetical protein FRB94_014275 [Tulasnella sp. JGI-2019a]|nr:hypothetical protein FRB94_014275 [Tulasnella sp. JGI-2019a]
MDPKLTVDLKELDELLAVSTTPENSLTHAKNLADLADRLTTSNRNEEAVKAGQKAVVLFRGLEDEHLVISSLESSLLNLSTNFTLLQRFAEAVEASQEAVDLRRAAVLQDPSTIGSLGTDLYRLGGDLSRGGRMEEAVVADKEATECLQKVAYGQGKQDDLLLELSCTLNCRSRHLRALGRNEEAIDVDTEVVKVYQVMAEKDAGETPALASAQEDLGESLSAIGRFDEAINHGREAVELRRKLLEKAPSDTQAYGNALNLLATSLSKAGRHEEAIPIGKESAEVIRRLASESTPGLLSALSVIVHNVATNLWRLGRQEEALPFWLEVVEVVRRLVKTEIAGVPPVTLAYALDMLSMNLASLERHEEAVKAGEEAVKEHRAAVQCDTSTTEPQLAQALFDLSAQYAAIRDYDKAVATAEEAVILRKRLADEGPDVAPKHLVVALSRLVKVL